MKPKKTRRLCDDPNIPIDVRKNWWQDMSDDLPDGAALAMMDEFGISVEDFDE